MNRIELDRIAERCDVKIESVESVEPFILDICYSTDFYESSDNFVTAAEDHRPAATFYNMRRLFKDGTKITTVLPHRVWKQEEGRMKCMNPKCDNTEEFQMASSRSLKDGGDVWCWVQCEECGMIGPKCDTAEDAKWFFEDREVLARPKSVNLNGDMGPGIFIRDEIDDWGPESVNLNGDMEPGIPIRTDRCKWAGKTGDEMDNFGPDGEEMRSLAAKSFSTYSNDHAWANKTGREILKDIEKLSDAMGIPAEVRDMKFGDGNSPSEAMHGFQELREYEAAENRMREKFRKLTVMGKPYKAEPEPPRGLTTEKIDWIAGRCGTEIEQIHVPTPGTVDIHFKGENPGASVSFMNQVLENKPEGILVRFHETREYVPYKPDGFFEVELNPGDKLALGNIEIEKDTVAMVTGKIYEPNNVGIPYTQFKAIAINNKPVMITSQKQADDIFGKGSNAAAMVAGCIKRQTENITIDCNIAVTPDPEKYPHKCDCGSACYDNGFKIKCMNSECNWYDGGKS